MTGKASGRKTMIAENSCESKTALFRANVREELQVATWNVGSLSGKSGEICEELGKRKIDICCLQETRWKGSGTRVISGKCVNYKLFWSGAKDEAQAGVGIMLAEKWSDKVIEVKRISSRLMSIKMAVGRRLVTVVSTYAPQVGRAEEEKDSFWDELFEHVSAVPTQNILIVGGDLNGHVGDKVDGYEGVHGGYGFGTRNEEGERILDFAVALEMVVVNTWFTKAGKNLVTYSSADCKTTVDYLLIRRKDRSFAQNVKVIPVHGHLHRIAIASLRVEGMVKRKSKFVPKLKVWRLKNETVKEEFINQLELKHDDVDAAVTVNGKWEKIKTSMLEATETSCGKTKGPRKKKESWWWSKEVEVAIKEKKESFSRWLTSKLSQDYDAYKQCRTLARRTVAKAKLDKQMQFAADLESKTGRNNVYKIAKCLSKERRDVIGCNCLRDAKGKIVVEEDEIKKVWKNYMEKLLNEENPFCKNAMEDGHPIAGCFEEIKETEIIAAMKKMKDGKASGQTGVVGEMLKASGCTGIKWLKDLFNIIMSEGAIPEDWNKSVLVPVFKGKGDPLDCGSYRAVKLLEHAMKVMERVLEQRIRRLVNINSMQFGFMPGRGTIDAIFVARQMQEKFKGKKKDLFFAFIDLEKAFDRIPRDVLRWAMRKAGVEESLVSAVMAMYSKPCTAVKTQSGYSEEFEVKVGVHQGSVLSPLLFIIVMDTIAKELGGEGLPWELLYADDLVLMADSEEGLIEKLKRWKDGMEGKGLKVNISKTKVLISSGDKTSVEKQGKFPCGVCNKGVGANSIECVKCHNWVHKRCSGIKGELKIGQTPFICRSCLSRNTEEVGRKKYVEIGNDQILERCGSFCYLGDTLSESGGASLAVTSRMRCAWKKFNEFRPLLKQKHVSEKLKGRLYASGVRTSMIYASETWALRKEDLMRLVRTERQMIRAMCGVTVRDKIKSVDGLSRLGIESVETIIRRNRLRWYGHVARKEEDDWTKKCMYFDIGGKNPRGRPMKTWKDNVREDMRVVGVKISDVSDRDLWRKKIRGKGLTQIDLY